MVKLTGTD